MIKAQRTSAHLTEISRPAAAQIPPMSDQTGFDALRDCADVGVLRQRSVIFAALSDDEAEAVIRLSRIVRYPARRVVIQEGEAGDQLLVLLRGRVKVCLNSPEGKEVTLGLLEPGDVFGEMALLDGEARSASVTTMEECSFLALARGDFLPFLESSPRVALKLLAALSKRLRATNDLVGSMSFLGLSARLARVLLNLVQHYGRIAAGGIVIGLKLSQEELGNLVGVSRESVNRQLRLWVDAGLIDMSHGSIVVKNSDALFREALSTGE